MYRDCEAWKSQNLPMNTTSNAAAKIFDSAITQYVTWREDPTYLGLENTMSLLVEEDPEFIMGHVFRQGVSLIGNSGYLPSANHEAANLAALASKCSKSLTQREVLHVDAIELASNGDLNLACDVWEKILVSNPTDILAAKFAHDSYFYLGYHERMRDCISRILPFWDPSLPLYSYLFGMLSFGLVETNYWKEAEKAALHALELNKYDAWAVHSVAHSREYQNDALGGIEFINKTENDWKVCEILSPHLYWHLALYHLEQKDHETVREIYRKKILDRAVKTKSAYDLVDAVSLIVRLKIDGDKTDFTKEVNQLVDAFKPQINNHGFLFNDLHILAVLSLSGNEELTKEYVESFNAYVGEKSNDYLRNVNREVGNEIHESIINYHKGNYEAVVDSLSNCRYKWIRFGGSNAQRDIFHQIMTDSALKSKRIEDKNKAKAWVNERLILKPKSVLNLRYFDRL